MITTEKKMKDAKDINLKINGTARGISQERILIMYLPQQSVHLRVLGLTKGKR